LRAQLLEPREHLGFPRQRALAPDPVDRTVASGGDDPRTGIARGPVARPALERGRERVLYRILGELEVAEDADQDRDCAAPLLAEEGFDR
jgi:hypothetical protein